MRSRRHAPAVRDLHGTFVLDDLHQGDEPVWGPLEALSTLVRQRRELPYFHPGEFMYMAGVGDARRRRIIHLYKHIDTRGSLNLDDGGHAYVYIDSPAADRRLFLQRP